MPKVSRQILSLTFLTLSYLLASFVAVRKGYFTDETSHLVRNKNEIDRNENSTPRSFVLPATPAVTEEQERKVGLLIESLDDRKCINILWNFGYPVLGSDGAFNAELIEEALLSFQETRKLIKSGILDRVTREKLGC